MQAFNRRIPALRCARLIRKTASRRNLGAFKSRAAAEHAGVLVARVEDARRAPRAIDGREDGQADLVDEAGAQERAVRAAAAFEQQALDPELAVSGSRAPARDRSRACRRRCRTPARSEDPRDGRPRPAPSAPRRSDRRRCRSGPRRSCRADRERSPRRPRRAGRTSVRAETTWPASRRIGLPLGEFAAGHAADQPGVALELVVQTLEQAPELAPFGRMRLDRMRPSTLETMWQIT